MTRPDFIIMGAMKSATSTLHTQLELQPGLFMSTPKEPNFFSDDEQYARGVDWYSSLFEKAGSNTLCGESSTHYTKLPDYPLTVERMAKHLTRVKLIYVMRHPIDRLVSHYMHQWSQNIIKCDINEAIDRYEELTAYSNYAMQLKPYIEQFGGANILPLFNEAIRQDPQTHLENIANFIDYKGDMKWHQNFANQNVSSERIREFSGYHWLVKSQIMTHLRRSLIPQGIRNKIKKELTLQHRPVIDEIHLNHLMIAFDKQLAQLGDWLGVKLSCESYHDVVLEKNHRFINI